jgi:hypothetical protein
MQTSARDAVPQLRIHCTDTAALPDSSWDCDALQLCGLLHQVEAWLQQVEAGGKLVEANAE